ncbi:MAG: response regulator [Bacteroidetes bacterium]|nr:response regulator [Bacteroidota bacterium]
MLKHFFTVGDGLSHNEVTSIVQDKDGFIWIGTRGGLNRYDGYEFKVFNQVPGDSNSLVNPSIEKLFIDSKGNIWIGSKSGGVSKYNPVTGIFKNIISNYKQSSEILPNNRILSFYEDKKERIWMGTWENGVVVYDEKNNTAQSFLTGNVNSIVESSDGKIWVGSQYGLYEFNEEDLSNKHHENTAPCQEIIYDDKRNVIWIVGGNNSDLRKFDLRNNRITKHRISDSFSNSQNRFHACESALVDSEDRLWVGTWGTGLYIFDQATENFERYLIYPENKQTLNKDYDTVLDVFQDKDNNIWLGTNGGGVCVLTPKMNFNTVGYHPESGKGLTNTRLMSVVDDREGNLWLGTIGSGLFWSPDRENFYQVEYPIVNKARFFIIKYLYQDNDGKIWAGTNIGTFLIEAIDGVPQMISSDVKYPSGNFGNQVVSFLDDENLFFSGTLSGGLYLSDKNNSYSFVKRLIKEDKKSGDLRSNRISYLLKDSKDRIWIGTYNGLHIFNKKDTTIQVAENYFEIKGEFTGNIITCIDEDQKGNIWIGTPNGLNKLFETDEDKFEIEYFAETEGLGSNFIKGISHDLNGNIWVSTGTGISKLVTKEENRIVNFDETDGVKGKTFTEASVFRNSKGEIFFGGTSGLTYFLPEEIIELSESTKPVFTGLSVLNKPVGIGKKYDSKIILKKAISRTDEIELSYRQNEIEIQFSALDFDSGGKNQYQFRLENHDEEWSEIGTRRFVIFNNLKPGEYVFQIKSSNRHNGWNEEPAQIKIVVKPPFWQTWYALLFYVLAVTGIVSIIRWNAVKQVRLANNLEMEKLQHEQDQKMSEMKFRFFTNISHEFRTPLTLILAPLKELVSKKDKYEISEEVSNKISTVQNNSLRLMKLVNQLLDFRKMESGNMKLSASCSNLEEFVSEICHPFQELAEINNIRFKFKSALKTHEIWFDRDKMEIVLNNLISNAFKFIRENGKIEVALYEEEDEVLVSVSDNGPGIPATEINHIFDRFYRVGQTENYASTGIGLALVKRFTGLQKGTISVTSTPNEHTEFIVSLLKGEAHLKPDEKVEIDNSAGGFIRKEQILSGILPGKSKPKTISEDCILIVEDNTEVKQYLKDLLEPLYGVETVSNGAEGFKKATELLPSLIISDVMMPVMDGFEFCKRIRSNDLTSTIPFIFLTAKSDEQFKLMGTQIGADDFISKPFDPTLLIEKVNNILTSRKKLEKKLSKSVRLEPSDIEITSSEEIFIGKLISIIEKNLQNPKFTSEVLASELNMSGSSLYRKLKGLTGSSTAEFIRSIRIKRAAQFLADREKTITEIAYDVGFNDVKHFRSVFQKQFSCSPSEYREKL